MNKKGKLILLPMPISENLDKSIVPILAKYFQEIEIYFVEEIKAVRRLMKKLDRNIDVDSKHFFLVNEHTESDFAIMKAETENGRNVGMMSDAGCVAVADPGKNVVHFAHQNKIKVEPIVSPSSIILALMSSGLEGQRFSFKGYLPKDKKERELALKNFELQSFKNEESVIFMDTPYRNMQVLDTILQVCGHDTMLCIACEITADDEFIMTQSISQWKENKPNINKKNVMFVLQKR